MIRVRVVLSLTLAVALVVGGASAAWALYEASAPAAFTAAIGRLTVSIDVPSSSSTLSTTATSVTAPITITNTGSLAGTATTAVTLDPGGPATVAQSVSVVAWPVTSSVGCTDASAVGSGAVTGTWASLPSLTSDLPAGRSATWCTRGTPDGSAPPSSSADVRIVVTLASGSWTATDHGGFTLSTATTSPVPALTCEDQDGNVVYLSWDAGSRPSDTSYGAFIGQTRVGVLAGNGYNRLPLSPAEAQSAVAADTTALVDILVVDASGTPTADRVASGTITLFTQHDGPAIRCGA